MEITTEMIKQLRDDTECGILDCRAALRDADGDFEQAKKILHEKGLAKVAKRADREASEGVIEIYSHGEGRMAVMVEVNCETDFVGRSKEFLDLAHELALQVAAANPLYVSEADIPQEALDEETRKATDMAKAENKPEKIIPKIVEGRLKKYKDQTVLLNQVYVRDDSKTVQDLINEQVAKMGEKIEVRRFVRWELGAESGGDEDSEEEDE
jgi:elongation factor Ts